MAVKRDVLASKLLYFLRGSVEVFELVASQFFSQLADKDAVSGKHHKNVIDVVAIGADFAVG